MSTQPEALRLAADLRAFDEVDFDDIFVRSSEELRRLHAEREAQKQQIEELEALRADAERWRFCANGKLFPEFCAHDSASPTGRSWYMPTMPIWSPPTFQSPEEAADHHAAFLKNRAKPAKDQP